MKTMLTIASILTWFNLVFWGAPFLGFWAVGTALASMFCPAGGFRADELPFR